MVVVNISPAWERAIPCTDQETLSRTCSHVRFCHLWLTSSSFASHRCLDIHPCHPARHQVKSVIGRADASSCHGVSTPGQRRFEAADATPRYTSRQPPILFAMLRARTGYSTEQVGSSDCATACMRYLPDKCCRGAGHDLHKHHLSHPPAARFCTRANKVRPKTTLRISSLTSHSRICVDVCCRYTVLNEDMPLK